MKGYIDIIGQETEYIMTEAELRRYRYETIKQYKFKKKARRIRFLKRALKGTMTCLFIAIVEIAFLAFCFMQI